METSFAGTDGTGYNFFGEHMTGLEAAVRSARVAKGIEATPHTPSEENAMLRIGQSGYDVAVHDYDPSGPQPT